LDGSPFNGLVNKYHKASGDAVAVAVGDLVKSTGTADTDGIPTVAQAAATDVCLGVIVGIVADTDESLNYSPASTEAYLLVADSPDVVYEIQEDSVGGALAATAVGGNCDVVVGAISTVGGGSSRMELDSSVVTTSAAQLRILRLRQKADNEIGVNAKWEVMINEHEHKQTAGV
jgi:hypothetical protein